MSRLDRRQFLTGASLFAAACATGSVPRRVDRSDLLLRHGTVFVGDGTPGFVGDVAITNDRIVWIGDCRGMTAATVLDVDGLCVAPGFVDIHTHSDRSIFRHPGAESRVYQGVTTEVTGNCGGSAAPRDPLPTTAADPDDGPAPWSDVASYGEAWARQGIALNQALLVGHGTLRRSVLGDVDRPANEAELAAMGRRLDLALTQGAIGMSTGLEYVPGIYAPSSEITVLARIVARHGGLYASHMRSEEERLLTAIDEVLAVGRDTGVRVQVSHLKACGRGNWGKLDAAIQRLERARAEGIDVMADAYPYTAYSTTLTILLEPWSREGGDDALMQRLNDPAARARMLAELPAHVAADPGGFELVVIANVDHPPHQDCVGKDLATIAAVWKVSPAEACLRLLDGSRGNVSYIGHGMADAGVERVLQHPLVMIGSDGSSQAPVGRQLSRPHPRSYGTFPRVLGTYCRDRALFDLPTALAKMTSMPAARARLADRGSLRVGNAADLVVFDAATIADRATYQEPQRYPVGMPHVLVNGRFVVRDGVATALRPGRFLRR